VIVGCCVCGRIKVVNGYDVTWEQLDLKIQSHGYCPECFRREVEKIEKEIEERKKNLDK